VQVHPDDRQAAERHPGQNGKTEAWVILDADPQNSLIYSGLIPGTTSASLRQAIDTGTVAQHLATYRPHPGDCFFLEAGTVHAIGAETLLFEVQQTSDITYRLYDWDRVDPKTGEVISDNGWRSENGKEARASS
jgi:mannose-6-phosphate isomerase